MTRYCWCWLHGETASVSPVVLIWDTVCVCVCVHCCASNRKTSVLETTHSRGNVKVLGLQSYKAKLSCGQRMAKWRFWSCELWTVLLARSFMWHGARVCLASETSASLLGSFPSPGIQTVCATRRLGSSSEDKKQNRRISSLYWSV